MSQMTLESGERLPARQQQHLGERQQEQDNLACPRCDSTNTKFCYYNNYNLSQPRHFCKSCRRYWTRGGALRNVPVGGGTRKSSSSSSKRPRSIPACNTSSCSSSSSTCVTYEVVPGNSVSYINGLKPEMVFRAPACGGVNLNAAVQVPGTGTFTSLLSTQAGCGFVPVDGFGAGFHGMGFGLSIWDWPTEQVGEPNSGGGGGGGGGGTTGVSVSAASSGSGTWQIGGVDGGLSDGDCFGWPELAISTPGNGLK